MLRVEWDYTLGPHAEKIALAAIEGGYPIPEDAIAPELPDECLFAYAAFNELMSTRAIGMDYGPIPWTAINDYAHRYRLEGLDEFDRFVRFIRAMESVVNAKLRHDQTHNDSGPHRGRGSGHELG